VIDPSHPRQTVEGAGVPLSSDVRGDGTPVLLVHDIAADARRWEPVAEALAAGGAARAIAYDRRGYGGSGAPQPYERTTVQEQAQDAAALLRGLDAPDAIGWGEGFGALVVLDLLVRMPGLLRAAVLVAPPLHQFSDAATEVLSQERARLEQALRDQGPEAAVSEWRPDADAALRASHQAFFADYAGLASWPVTRRELRSIAVPVAVVTDPATPAHLVAEADALARLLPDARRSDDGDPLAALRALLPGA
jgi:esterase